MAEVEEKHDFVCLVIDTHSKAWEKITPKIPLHMVCEAVVGFITQHLFSARTNKFALITAGAPVKLIYNFLDDKVLSLADVGKEISHRLMNYLEENDAPSVLPAALTKMLCFIRRAKRACPFLAPRILCLNASLDSPAHYEATMNCIFESKKLEVPIDALTLVGSDILQQAAYMTSGIHLEPHAVSTSERNSLFQYLTFVFAPSVEARKSLCLPECKNIGGGVRCFCHQEHTQMGYICVCCLSIFCGKQLEKSPDCMVCGTRLKPKPNERRVSQTAAAGVRAGQIRLQQQQQQQLQHQQQQQQKQVPVKSEGY
eukprot:TRINITY_DN23_c7_g1_i1.p1 TRINITY_DN23_c7_g1~~TRINITY_DN23_c7_g1_i1.p1  ORF type:complete len:313 (-),score=81.59 TRINITY_DN23_c7_g1_i1:128-1066(-)